MSRPSPTPDAKARWRSEAIAAIGRRLRLVYLASDFSTIPARLKRLLKALDRRVPRATKPRGGLTARTEGTPHEHDDARV